MAEAPLVFSFMARDHVDDVRAMTAQLVVRNGNLRLPGGTIDIAGTASINRVSIGACSRTCCVVALVCIMFAKTPMSQPPLSKAL